MSTDAKLGLVAGVLAVVGVAAFGGVKNAPSPPTHSSTNVAVPGVSLPPSSIPASISPPSASR